MNTIGLLVGEDADLPEDMIENSPVSIFTYTINWESLTDISSFYKMLRSAQKAMPTTSQPSIKIFKELFENNLKKYQDLIVITISSAFSGTYNAANQAKKLFSEKEQRRIHIVDSQSLSGGEALLLFTTLQLIASGEKVATILDKLKIIIPTIHFIGVFDDPKWLQKGGRINAVQAMLVSNMLRAGFRPILTIRDGQIVTKKIQKNARDKASALFHQFKEDIIDSQELAKRITVVITHSDCKKDANILKNMIESYNSAIIIRFINIISPVIGTHLGYDALLLAWIAE